MQQKRKTAAAQTIGCRLNQAETALIYDRLTKAGYTIVDANSTEPITVYIINSCTVTSVAAQKSRQNVRKIRKKHPDTCIIITGCSTETEKEFWEQNEDINIVVPNSEKSKILTYIDNYFQNREAAEAPVIHDPIFFEKAFALTPFRSRAFIKVQEGCNAFCSYCIVPYARGRERSRHWDEVICEAQNHIDNGYKELVLTGVNICAYEHENHNLADVVKAISAIPGDFRIRLSSTEPNPNNHDLLDVIADNPKVCRFLHLPLQHGTDEILKAMNRHYSTADYANFAEKALEKIPGLHLGTDVIVGFPGETDQLFEDCCQFIKSLPFANLHIFTYSKRAGTPAVDFSGHVPKQIAKERHATLSAIEKDLSAKFAASQVGQDLVVLTEKKLAGDRAEGWSDNYLRVSIQGSGLDKNQLIEATIRSVENDNLLIGIHEEERMQN